MSGAEIAGGGSRDRAGRLPAARPRRLGQRAARVLCSAAFAPLRRPPVRRCWSRWSPASSRSSRSSSGAQLAFDAGTILDVVPPLAAGADRAWSARRGRHGAARPRRPTIAAIARAAARGNQRTRRAACAPADRLPRSLVTAAALVAEAAQRAAQRRPVHGRTRASRIRGTQAAPSNIVLVAIDDKTFITSRRRRIRSRARTTRRCIRNLARPGRR